MPSAIVLGAGLVGSVMAADLARDGGIEVTVADRDQSALDRAASRSGGSVRTIQQDLSDAAALMKLIAPFDVVVGAVGSVIGFQTLRAVIEAGKNFCDICFMSENALELDALAKQHNVTAIVDCGVAPGMSNMIAGYAVSALDTCSSLEIYVGGLPRVRQWPFEYKAGFSPYDVIEEYTRPARLVENGKIVIRKALSEPELMNLPGIDTLEAFNTDGLRSLAETLDVPDMKEKTLRYPGHIELMRVFRETGLFSHDEIEVAGVRVRPLDVTSALMFPKWSYEEGEEDLTVMRIIAKGKKNGRETTLTWDLLDFYDAETRATSMARTTAFPCTIMARHILSGAFNQRGVIVPEYIGGQAGWLDRVIKDLGEKGIVFSTREATV